MDVVICLHITDIPVIKRNVPMIRKNIKGVENVYIITDKRNNKYFSFSFCKRYEVRFIDENALVEGLTKKKIEELVISHFGSSQKVGWYLQQFLKLSFCESCYAKKDYLVWDADTIPVRTLSFKDEDGKALFTLKSEYHKPYFDTMQKILGITKTTEGSYITEHMLFNVSFLKEMLEKIQNNESLDGNTWWEKVLLATNPQEPIGFSEFETYGTYISITHPNSITYRHLSTLREGGEKYSFLMSNNSFDKIGLDYDTISFEKYMYPSFPLNVRCFLHRLYYRVVNRIRILLL